MSRIVVPGEVVADKPQRMAYSFSDGQKTYAVALSLLGEDGKLVPLEGPYEPLVEDIVVGYVTDIRFTGYNLDLGSPFSGFLSSRDPRATVSLGSIVQARIINVDEVRSIDLADARPLNEGSLERISPVKVPRLIGKRNSMINLISQMTGCQLVVGRNGYVFVSAKGSHSLALKAIRMVEAQAHTSGLTDRVASMLNEERARAGQPPMQMPQQA
ncbi:MAG: KH domain-containing protein [Candidatus Marsarchaeota archaeon]|nr:KH domain-containing protein [Candidatus Marsarchaeota archaeon]